MPAGDSDAQMPPGLPDPFVLIAGAPRGLASPGAAEAAIRRMGLQPQRIGPASGEAPRFRLAFGSTTAIAARADAATLAAADPADSANSSLACALPADWRDGDCCWIVRPGDGSAVEAPVAWMRDYFKLVALLVDLFDASHIYWSPARLWSDAPQFRAAIAEMLTSGMPPVLHLVAFRRRGAGPDERVATRGLALFGGQELEAGIPAGWTMADMVKRLARLALDVMLHGPVTGAQNARGLEGSEIIRLIPESRDGRAPATVRVDFGRQG